MKSGNNWKRMEILISTTSTRRTWWCVWTSHDPILSLWLVCTLDRGTFPTKNDLMKVITIKHFMNFHPGGQASSLVNLLPLQRQGTGSSLLGSWGHKSRLPYGWVLTLFLEPCLQAQDIQPKDVSSWSLCETKPDLVQFQDIVYFIVGFHSMLVRVCSVL